MLFINFDKITCWTFWAIFPQTYLVTLFVLDLRSGSLEGYTYIFVYIFWKVPIIDTVRWIVNKKAGGPFLKTFSPLTNKFDNFLHTYVSGYVCTLSYVRQGKVLQYEYNVIL
jgi:hypothetical protein